MRAKRKLLISMLAIVFVLLAVVATIAIAFALTQQTITTTLNIGYTVEDIDGTASATYTIGGVTESLTAMKGDTVIGDTLVFRASDTEDAGNLMFPEGQIPLTAQNDNIVIQYTYSNTGAKHYIASMSFDAELKYDNMKVEYSIDGTTYSENRYAVVVPANTANKNYWIRISVDNKAKSASFVGDFNWLLNGCDEQSEEYLSLTSLEFTGSNGSYSASVASEGEYAGALVFPSEVNGDAVTTIAQNTSLTQEQRNQVTSVYIPDSVTTIGDGAFRDFRNLQTVTFEQNETSGAASVKSGTGLTTIAWESFSRCYNLKELKFPSTLQSIAFAAFAQANNFERLEIVGTGGTFHSAGNCIINTSTKELVLGCKNSVIPTDGSVTSIGMEAFSYCTGLTGISIPSSVTAIGSETFLECTGLKEIVIPDSVGIVGSSDYSLTFYNCINLEKLTFGAGIHTWHYAAVSGCTKLKTIIARSLPALSLEDELAYVHVIIDDNVTAIRAWCLYIGDSVTKITIGSGVTSIEIDTFALESACDNLTEVVFKNPTGWTAGTTAITETQLSDATNAATLLKTTYGTVAWIRN